MSAHSKRRRRKAAEDRVLDLIDNTLQSPMMGHNGSGELLEPGRCVRCRRSAAPESDWCAPCRAWMLGDDVPDPIAHPQPPVFTQRQPPRIAARIPAAATLLTEAPNNVFARLHTQSIGMARALAERYSQAPRHQPTMTLAPELEVGRTTRAFGGSNDGKQLGRYDRAGDDVLVPVPQPISWRVAEGSGVPEAPQVPVERYTLFPIAAGWLRQQASVWAWLIEGDGRALALSAAILVAYDEWLGARLHVLNRQDPAPVALPPWSPVRPFGFNPHRGDQIIRLDGSGRLEPLTELSWNGNVRSKFVTFGQPPTGEQLAMVTEAGYVAVGR